MHHPDASYAPMRALMMLLCTKSVHCDAYMINGISLQSEVTDKHR